MIRLILNFERISPSQAAVRGYSGKNVFSSQQGSDPTRITMIMNTPTETIVHYVDLSNFWTNERHKHKILENDWGFSFKYGGALDGDNSVITDPGQFLNHQNYSVEIPTLLNFQALRVDFIGASRRGNTWKGSRMIYTED